MHYYNIKQVCIYIGTATNMSQLEGEIVDTRTTLTESAGIATSCREVDPEEAASRRRVKVFASLVRKVSNNEFGLPEYIYRADLIPAEFDGLNLEEQEKVLQAASIDLLFREGYPTFHDGRAFWSKMEFEPQQFYDVFKLYLGMVATHGVRRLEVLEEEYEEVKLSPQSLSEAFTYYYWEARCKAYDLFRVAAYHREREARIMSTNNRLFLKAERLLTQLEGYFKDVDDDGIPLWLKDLTPGVAITALERLAKLQRIALDLPANGPSQNAEAELPANSSMDALVRTLVRRSEGELTGSSTRRVDLEMLLRDPEAARAAQELVIRIGRANGTDRTDN